MLKTYKGIQGQSILDVCLMTYGAYDNSLDKLLRLMQDNNIDSVNSEVQTGQEFIYDDNLILNAIEISTNAVNIVTSIYATKTKVSSAQQQGFFLMGEDGRFILTETDSKIPV